MAYLALWAVLSCASPPPLAGPVPSPTELPVVEAPAAAVEGTRSAGDVLREITVSAHLPDPDGRYVTGTFDLCGRPGALIGCVSTTPGECAATTRVALTPDDRAALEAAMPELQRPSACDVPRGMPDQRTFRVEGRGLLAAGEGLLPSAAPPWSRDGACGVPWVVSYAVARLAR